MLRNYEIARILHEVGIYEEIKWEKFKPRAYEKAALYIGSLNEDLDTTYKRGGIKALAELPGIGKSIAQKLAEIISTGKLQYYEGLKKQIPVDLTGLTSIEGIGPKTVKVLYEQLGITNIEELEKASKEEKLRNLPGFGEKTEQQILNGIKLFRKTHVGRFILGLMISTLEDIGNRLGRLNIVKKVELAGSVRRMKESIGDADFVVVSNQPEKLMDFFTSMPEVAHVNTKGITKSTVRLRERRKKISIRSLD